MRGMSVTTTHQRQGYADGHGMSCRSRGRPLHVQSIGPGQNKINKLEPPVIALGTDSNDARNGRFLAPDVHLNGPDVRLFLHPPAKRVLGPCLARAESRSGARLRVTETSAGHRPPGRGSSGDFLRGQAASSVHLSSRAKTRSRSSAWTCGRCVRRSYRTWPSAVHTC